MGLIRVIIACERLASILEGVEGFVEWPLFLIFDLIRVDIGLIGGLLDLIIVRADLIYSF